MKGRFLLFCLPMVFALTTLAGQFSIFSSNQNSGVSARGGSSGNAMHVSASASQQEKKGYPRYCCTEAGVLGPYNNDSVPEGGDCYGTKNGRRYEGKACYSKDDSKGGSGSQEKKGYPKY